MNSIRLAVVGAGNMGAIHASHVLEGKIARCELAAVCDRNPARLAPYSQVPCFAGATALCASGLVDAVLIAAPHYSHAPIGIDAFECGLHVLSEKPIAVHKADAAQFNAAFHRASARRPLVFAAMFQQRTEPRFQKVRQLIHAGELGQVRRIQWTITNWFRSQAYYASGGWRATWAGEGGGVLLNQAPHNLDLWQWIFGMPARVRAFCTLGRYHPIEVEDDVTAYFEYADGATGVFITSTGEAPGTNRLEVAGERGRLVLEDDSLSFLRNEVPMSEFSRTTTTQFAPPPVWNVQIPIPAGSAQHDEIITNFVAAILDGTPLVAPGVDGIHSVELANAMLLSSFRNETVELPLDGEAYSRHLEGLIAASKFRKPPRSARAPA